MKKKNNIQSEPKKKNLLTTTFCTNHNTKAVMTKLLHEPLHELLFKWEKQQPFACLVSFGSCDVVEVERSLEISQQALLLLAITV